MTGTRLFGTDGIRSEFGTGPLVEDTVVRLGFELAWLLAEWNQEPAKLVIGGDTRESTDTLVRWIRAGVLNGGGTIEAAGVLPTPGVAFLTKELGADTGIVISASHNPHQDNGIKLIGPDGFKWSLENEQALERRLAGKKLAITGTAEPYAVNRELGERYYQHLLELNQRDGGLEGLRVAIDAGNGAASAYAGRLFEALGAEVHLAHDDPNGTNINLGCGATEPEAISRMVQETKADLGVSLDGDADRAILCDETGAILDGDAILFLMAGSLAERGALGKPRIVATSMSNLGLTRALARLGIELVRCDVGDRAVVDTLREHNLKLGGEQSGHIVYLDQTTTGDGILTALQISHILKRAKRPLSELISGFERFPQVLLSVRVDSKPELGSLDAVTRALEAAEQELGDQGRIVLRYSGTEPLARVMIEGQDKARIDQLAQELADTIVASTAT